MISSLRNFKKLGAQGRWVRLWLVLLLVSIKDETPNLILRDSAEERTKEFDFGDLVRPSPAGRSAYLHFACSY